MSLKALIKNIKELGLKEVMKRAKEGIAQAPMDKLLKVELNGYIYSIIGTLFAGIMLLIFARTYWYLIFAFIFSIMIYASQYLQKYQLYKQFKMINEIQIQPEQIGEIIKKNIELTNNLNKAIEEKKETINPDIDIKP